jgi:hypothetical protein
MAGVQIKKTYPINFNIVSGQELLQNDRIIQKSHVGEAELPSGIGITNVKFVPQKTIQKEKKERAKSAMVLSKVSKPVTKAWISPLVRLKSGHFSRK